MAKKSEHDFAVKAFRVVEKAIGEHMDGTPLETKPVKRSSAVENGKRGGKKGGTARAIALSADRRKAIAVKAANSRWGNAVKRPD